MVLEYLPSPDVLDLAIASSSFHAHIQRLPNSFWRSRLSHHYLWMDDPRFHRSLASAWPKVNYFDVLLHLRKWSREMQNERPHWVEYGGIPALMNKRRIWNCCRAILHIMSMTTSHWINSYGPLYTMMIEKASPRGLLYSKLTYHFSLTIQISQIHAFFPNGQEEGIGGLAFVLADGITLFFGRCMICENAPAPKSFFIAFDLANNEEIGSLFSFHCPKSHNMTKVKVSLPVHPPS